MGQEDALQPASSEEQSAQKPIPVYIRSSPDEPLRQGEIVSDLVQVKIKLDSIGSSEGYVGVDVVHPLAIVVTQDCDLEQDFKARFAGEAGKHRILPNILFCEVELANELRHGDKNDTLPEEKRARSKEINRDIWKNIWQNKDERYHFLQKVEPAYDLLEQGIDALGIEFKRYFTVPTDDVYHRVKIKQAKRRCKLNNPHLEHFSVRFHYYHYRVALPADHRNE